MTASQPLTAGQSEDAAVQLENDFAEIIRTEIGMHPAFATQVGQAIVRGLRHAHGGSELYIPAPDRSERDAAIRRDFTGSNCEELMRRHGLSRARIYAIAGQRLPGKSPTSPLKTGQTTE